MGGQQRQLNLGCYSIRDPEKQTQLTVGTFFRRRPRLTNSTGCNTSTKITRKKVYPKHLPYNQILSGVTFVMSGFENPRRGDLRDLATAMGAKYQTKWSRHCTHLICAFKNTLKYKEVMAEDGRVVREHWIRACHRYKKLLDWRAFKLGKYPYPDSEEEVEVEVVCEDRHDYGNIEGDNHNNNDENTDETGGTSEWSY